MENFYEEILQVAIGILLVITIVGVISFLLTTTLYGKTYRELFKVQRTIENINKVALDYLVKTGGDDNVGGTKKAEEIIQELIKQHGISPRIVTIQDFNIEIEDKYGSKLKGHSDHVRGDKITITTSYRTPMISPNTVLGISLPQIRTIKPRKIVTEGYVHRFKQIEEEEGMGFSY